ncbi:hypothetical protein OG590_25285 [Streptomyces goshikiensis]|uniref:hypothetical protein n=1 Tax=Streptomyces TaxID=1883 RepID=UPI000F556326|nr:hypothetical protein [Streptomyces sp. ADI91-18]RPK53326.1 hypothetical protein EES37_01995 [Streptomyces sp. ADI91-18]WSY00265.1 hypothetical protein OG590_25285 [Streptomyces goshikiensis]
MPDTFAPMRATRAAMFAAVCVALAAAGHSYMSGMDIPMTGLLCAFGVIGALAWLAAGRRRGPYGITASLLAAQGVLHLTLSGSQTPAMAAGHPHPPTHAPGTPPPGMPAAPSGASPLEGMPPMPGLSASPAVDGLSGVPGLSASSALDGVHHMPGLSDPSVMDGMGGMGGMDHMAGLSDPSVMDGLTGMGALDWLTGLVAMAGHGGLGMIAAHLLAALFCAGWLAWGEAAVFRLARALGATALLAARPLASALALVRTQVAPVPPRPAPRRTCARPRRLRGAVHAHAVVRRGPPGGRALRATAPGLPARA